MEGSSITHTIYYQFGGTKFKLETTSNNLDDYLDQFNILEVKHIEPSEFDDQLIEGSIISGDIHLSHYRL